MNLRGRFILVCISLLVMLCFTYTLTGRRGHSLLVRPNVSLRTYLQRAQIVNQTVDYIRDDNEELDETELRTIAQRVFEESKRYNIDYRLILALMKVESNFRKDAVSEMGARGLLQIKPSLAECIAPDVGIAWKGAETLDEPGTNIRIGVHFFSKLVEEFKGLNAALHAYNVGPTRLRDLDLAECNDRRGFSRLVMDEYDRNSAVLPEPPAREEAIGYTKAEPGDGHAGSRGSASQWLPVGSAMQIDARRAGLQEVTAKTTVKPKRQEPWRSPWTWAQCSSAIPLPFTEQVFQSR